MRGENGQRQVAVWLVKSGGKILGPYSENELSAKLRNRELLVIDEVTLPMSRWRVIRDEPVFASVVEEVRKVQMNTREDTEVQGHTQTRTLTQNQTQTQTSTETESVTVEFEDDVTTTDSVLSPIDSTPIDASQVQDAEFVEVSDHNSEESRRETGRIRQYGILDATPETPSSGFNFKVLMWSTAVVVSVVALWLYLYGRGVRETPVASYNQHDFSRILNEAKTSWAAGDFGRALTLFRQADSIHPRQPEVVSRLAPLLIHLEAQTVAAKRAIRETLQNTKAGDSVFRAELELGMALASLAGDEFNEADTHCQSALTLSPGWMPARFTCGVVAYQKKEYAKAAASFREAGDEPAALLMSARSLVSMNRYGRSPERRQAEDLIERLVTRHQDFRQEGLVISAFLEIESGNKRAATQKARAALDVDPELTNSHWHDPFLYLEPLGWRSLVPFCRRVASEARSSITRALLGLCLYKSGSRTEASEVIADAVAQASGPGLQLLQSVNAYIMASSGRIEDARAALKLATKEDPPALAMLVRARVCTRLGDTACAEQSWLDLNEGKDRNLPALVGLAGFRMLRGDRIGAMGYVEKARHLSPTYLPARLFEEVGSTR